MTRFAEFLRLREPWRESLKLSPARDSAIFVDLDDVLPKVKKQLSGVPKLVVFGDIGTGKSHLLRHIEKNIAPAGRFRPVFVPLSGFERSSRFRQVHALVMDALEQPLLEVLEMPSSVDGWIERAPLSLDVRTAFRKLRDPKLLPADRARVRAWLKGPGVTATQAQKLGFSGRLFDYAGPAQLVDLWKAVGELYQQHAPNRAMLLLLFDEGESIQQVLSPEGQHDLGNGFRQLLDPDNHSVGCVFGLNMPVGRGLHPFLRADVVRRYDDAAINLRPIAGPERTRLFVEALWSRLAGDAPLLLAPEALEFVGMNLASFRERVGITTTEPLNRAPTQGDLLVVLDFIAQSAVESQVAPPVPVESVRAWLHAAGA